MHIFDDKSLIKFVNRSALPTRAEENIMTSTQGILPGGCYRRIPDNKNRNTIDVGGVQVTLMRTLRVPEGQRNMLPPGLGTFPIYKVSDFRSGTPKEWNSDAYFFPIYPQEAMWMSFNANQPRALIVAAGNVNALSGKPFGDNLDVKLETPQNYVVLPTQPWLDGFKAEDGKVYQFVAAELGSGETVEGQITGKETVGGIQFISYNPMKPLPVVQRPGYYALGGSLESACAWTHG